MEISLFRLAGAFHPNWSNFPIVSTQQNTDDYDDENDPFSDEYYDHDEVDERSEIVMELSVREVNKIGTLNSIKTCIHKISYLTNIFGKKK